MLPVNGCSGQQIQKMSHTISRGESITCLVTYPGQCHTPTTMLSIHSYNETQRGHNVSYVLLNDTMTSCQSTKGSSPQYVDVLVFFSLALRKMAAIKRHLQSKVDWYEMIDCPLATKQKRTHETCYYALHVPVEAHKYKSEIVEANSKVNIKSNDDDNNNNNNNNKNVYSNQTNVITKCSPTLPEHKDETLKRRFKSTFLDIKEKER
uniref:Uncharacterized protein n=1 Tax=Glossina austeni TaxID=7395 RepID=A0A1A9V1I5_GLOAU